MDGRFNLFGKKRANEGDAAPRSDKLPRASQISIEQGPRPMQAPKRLPVTAPVDVCIYRVTELASDLWDLLQGHDHALFQIQVRHDAQRNITFDVRNSFNDFLRAAHKQDPHFPINVTELETACGVRLIVTDRADPDDVGYKQWRVAFYCVDLPNFLLLLDGFFKYKDRQSTQPFQVVIHPHSGIDVSLSDLEYKYYVVEEPKRELPLHIFEAQPVITKRITWMNIQIESETVISIIFTGNLWPYRQRLDKLGVFGGYFGDDDNKEHRKYYRVFKNIDVNDQNQIETLMNLLGDDAFKKLCMRVTLDALPVSDTVVQKFIDGQLRELPYLFFAPQPQVTNKEDQGRIEVEGDGDTKLQKEKE